MWSFHFLAGFLFIFSYRSIEMYCIHSHTKIYCYNSYNRKLKNHIKQYLFIRQVLDEMMMRPLAIYIETLESKISILII
jgi:hypothetical protein